MKKIAILFIIAVLAVFVLAACGSGQPESGSQMMTTGSQGGQSGTSGTPAPAQSGTGTVSGNTESPSGAELPDFALRVGEFLIEMDQDMNYALEALGEPGRVFEEPSCAFDGIDRIFGYPDLQIHTYPVGDADHIHTIMFLNDLVRTTEGRIRIRHSSLQDVIDAYGDEYVHEAGMYTYTRGLTTLEFYIDDGIVEGITYGFIIV